MGLEYINKRKKELKLTNETLSKLSGVPRGTLDKITAGITQDPKLRTLIAIARVLNCSLNDFDDVPNDDTSTQNLLELDREKTLLKKYNALDKSDKSTVDLIFNKPEYNNTATPDTDMEISEELCDITEASVKSISENINKGL